MRQAAARLVFNVLAVHSLSDAHYVQDNQRDSARYADGPVDYFLIACQLPADERKRCYYVVVAIVHHAIFVFLAVEILLGNRSLLEPLVALAAGGFFLDCV